MKIKTKYAHVTRTITLFTPHCYDTNPLFIQIPIDGVNAKSTLTVHYSNADNQENNILTTETAAMYILGKDLIG